jgi:hypothetical protein
LETAYHSQSRQSRQKRPRVQSLLHATQTALRTLRPENLEHVHDVLSDDVVLLGSPCLIDPVLAGGNRPDGFIEAL